MTMTMAPPCDDDEELWLYEVPLRCGLIEAIFRIWAHTPEEAEAAARKVWVGGEDEEGDGA